MKARVRPESSAISPDVETPETELVALQTLLRYTFHDSSLLVLALTHTSFAVESATDPKAGRRPAGQDNEQLEFVGDAALGLLTAESLYRRFPSASEGDLTRMRASVISRKHLGEVGGRLGIGRWLRLGLTAERNGSRERPSLFSNAMEALIAALYLDGGLDAARTFVEREVLGPALPGMLEKLDAAAATPRSLNGAVGDHKTALQEFLRAADRGQPEYRLLAESGPAHQRMFEVDVRVVGEDQAGALASASGASKKKAQQEAARLALASLEAAGSAEGSR